MADPGLDPAERKPPTRHQSPLTCGLARANSRSRGIHLKTVSPAVTPTNHHNRNSAHESTAGFKTLDKTSTKSQDGVAARSGKSTRKVPDVTIASRALLEALDINDQLRLLALKEMAVVETKDAISNLKHKLRESEKDLQRLRGVIQSSIYKQLHSVEAAQRNRRQKPLTSTRLPAAPSSDSNAPLVSQEAQKSVTAKSDPKLLVAYSHSGDVGDQAEEHSDSAGDRHSRLWDNLSKPIAFIQNLDSRILQEFERSLASNDIYTPDRALKLGNTTPDSSFEENKENDPEDVFQVVSNSLWNFVNDMKTNMIATLNEEPLPHRKDHSNERPTQASHPGLDPEPSSQAEEHAEDEDEDEDEVLDLSMYALMRRR